MHTCFYKENDTAQPNTDRLRRPWSKSAHTSLAHSSPRVAIQQGAPRRTGRQWPGGRFCSPGPPAARNLRCVGTKRKRVSLHACPRSAHGVHRSGVHQARRRRKKIENMLTLINRCIDAARASDSSAHPRTATLRIYAECNRANTALSSTSTRDSACYTYLFCVEWHCTPAAPV